MILCNETVVLRIDVKAILGSAALFGMTQDLNLSITDRTVSPPKTDTTRLSWATSIFYFGQLIGSYPMAYALQRFKTTYTLGPVVMIWAIICAATAGVTSWQGLLVQRFFLGEYSTGPGTRAMLLTLCLS